MLAYALRADYEGIFRGGILALDGDRSFDTAQALEEGDGTIIVDDANIPLVLALDAFPALKRVSLPDNARVSQSAYDAHHLNALRHELRRRGIKVRGNITKQAAIDALVEHDNRLQAGDQDANAAPDNLVTADPDGAIITPAERAELDAGEEN